MGLSARAGRPGACRFSSRGVRRLNGVRPALPPALPDLPRILPKDLPNPDGSPATLPAGSRVMWAAYDGRPQEPSAFPGAFGFPPEALLLNAGPGPDEIFGETARTGAAVDRLEARIEAARPALLFIDTVTYATD